VRPTAGIDTRSGRLAENVVHFSRVLRAAGVPVGTDRVILTLEALKVAGLESRDDLRSVLESCLIDRAQHRLLFDQAFHVFWKDPDLLGQMLRLLLPQVSEKLGGAHARPPENRRLGEALAPTAPRSRSAARPERIEVDARLSASDREQLRKADFDTMSTAELAAARRMLQAIVPFFARLPTRRDTPSPLGPRFDLRAVLRESARRGGDIATLPRRRRRTHLEPLVVIVDISGSMSRYSRMFLHFVHALAGGPGSADYRVHVFVFGTRLTNVTRQLRHRDPDLALSEVVRAVDDWSGGTRIAACLHEFNRHWARRVLSGNPTVLLVTDGLEHREIDELGREAEWLARSCRRLVWLNPLLRYEAFEPRARGVRALLAHVSSLLPVHNLESLEQLASVLAGARHRKASPVRT
jgi:uncharacterized protein with von Willebrand factor type A (vWA) domain